MFYAKQREKARGTYPVNTARGTETVWQTLRECRGGWGSIVANTHSDKCETEDRSLWRYGLIKATVALFAYHFVF